MRFLKDHPILLVFVTLLLGVSVALVNKANQSSSGKSAWSAAQEILVVAKPIQKAEFIEEIEAIGTTQANESVNITAKVTETVQEVNFEDGLFVEKGRVLVHLTNAEETALLFEAQATLDEASQQYKRVSNLLAQKLASQVQVDEEYARQQTAKARLDAIMARLDDRLIRAPFSGKLGFRNVSEGSLIMTGTVITTLDDVSQIKLDFTVPEMYLSALHIGLEVFASSSAYPEHKFKGLVTGVNSRVDPVTRSVIVRAVIPNETNLLRPGMLMTVKLIRDRAMVKVVAEESLIPIADEQFIYRINEDNTVERIAVKIGRRRPGLAEILSELPVGTSVVAEGVIHVRPGSKVKIKQQAMINE